MEIPMSQETTRPTLTQQVSSSANPRSGIDQYSSQFGVDPSQLGPATAQYGPAMGKSAMGGLDYAARTYSRCDWTFYAMIGLVLSLVYLISVWVNPKNMGEWLRFIAYVILVTSGLTIYVIYKHGDDPFFADWERCWAWRSVAHKVKHVRHQQQRKRQSDQMQKYGSSLPRGYY